MLTAANAAEERGTDLPYWRTIKNSGEENAKYSKGYEAHHRYEAHQKHLESEGISVMKKGKKYFVSDFDTYLSL